MNYQFPKSGQQVVNKHHISYFLLSGDFFEVCFPLFQIEARNMRHRHRDRNFAKLDFEPPLKR